MSIIYKSQRIGKNGKKFKMYKFRTLKDGTDKTSSFTQKDQYLPLGRFLRKTKLDELPSIVNVLKRDMNVFGYRPEEERSFRLLPNEVKQILSSTRPGMVDLSSLHFFDEEHILQVGDSHETYWEKIRPMKLAFQVFYIQNRCFLLNVAITWIVIKKMIKSLFV